MVYFLKAIFWNYYNRFFKKFHKIKFGNETWSNMSKVHKFSFVDKLLNIILCQLLL